MSEKQQAKAPAAEKQEPPKTVEVVLKAPHTHGGEAYGKGDKITVREPQVAWLRKRGLI